MPAEVPKLSRTLETSTEAIGVHPVSLGAAAGRNAKPANGHWRAERRRPIISTTCFLGGVSPSAVDSVHENVGAFAVLAFPASELRRARRRPAAWGIPSRRHKRMRESDRKSLTGRKRRAVHVDDNMSLLPSRHCGCKINFWTRQLSSSAT